MKKTFDNNVSINVKLIEMANIIKLVTIWEL